MILNEFEGVIDLSTLPPDMRNLAMQNIENFLENVQKTDVIWALQADGGTIAWIGERMISCFPSWRHYWLIPGPQLHRRYAKEMAIRFNQHTKNTYKCTASVITEHTAGHRFALFFGFQPTAKNDIVTFYERVKQ